ncbi:hypothetical protein A3765_25195 [Oleiphilus sp. HI0130]|nr:hypothetical protein A3765_25195 [Oleiphilus sp. HI0130]
MKRFFAAILVLLVVLVGGSKIAVMIGASSFLSQVKTELVSVGALNSNRFPRHSKIPKSLYPNRHSSTFC